MTIRQKAPKKYATQVQGIETSDLSKIPKTYRAYITRGQQDEVEASLELYESVAAAGGKDKTDDFEHCRFYTWFKVSCVTRKIRVVSNSCRLRWCPICSDTLGRFRTHSIANWLSDQGNTRFLTLTLKHSDEDLGEQIKKLYYYFKQLRKIKYFKQVVTGGIWFFQLKRSSRTGEWHPHLHCLITGSYIIHPRLSAIWEKITHGSTVVHIKSITNDSTISKYASRYSSRPATLSEYTNKDRLEIFAVCNGKRLCGKWGTGNDCQLCMSTGADLSEWKSIGSWRTVVHHAPFLSYARIVFKCWKQDRAVPDFIDLHCLDRPDHLIFEDEVKNAVLLTFHEMEDI